MVSVGFTRIVVVPFSPPTVNTLSLVRPSSDILVVEFASFISFNAFLKVSLSADVTEADVANLFTLSV
ncbi:hypothetical protein D3C73_1617060 [compost metagenome]